MATEDIEVYRRCGELQRDNAALKVQVNEQEKRIADLKAQLEQANALAHEAIGLLSRPTTKKAKKR